MVVVKQQNGPDCHSLLKSAGKSSIDGDYSFHYEYSVISWTYKCIECRSCSQLYTFSSSFRRVERRARSCKICDLLNNNILCM